MRRKSSLVETKKFQAIAAAKAPRESRLDPLSDKSHDGTCAAQVESNLVLNGVVFQNGILNYSFPAGEQIRESQLQMIIPESGYLERMAELGRLQLETQNMTTPSSCPAHKRNAKKRERTRTVWPPPTHLQKAHAHYAPHHIIPLPPPTLSFPKIFISAKAQTSRQDRVMPPRRTRQPPTHNLSWFSTPQRQVVLHQVHGLINERDRRDRRVAMT